MAIILWNLKDIQKFSLEDFVVHIYTYLQQCETLISGKQAINDKLKGICSVPTYLRCSGVVNNQIKKGLLLSCHWKKIVKVTNKNAVVSCTFFVFSCVVARRTKCARDNHLLACNFAKYSLTCSSRRKRFWCILFQKSPLITIIVLNVGINAITELLMRR